MLQLAVCYELGYTLARLNQEVTLEELLIHSAYLELRNEVHEKAMKQRR